MKKALPKPDSSMSRLRPLHIAAIYAVAGALWIPVSDRLLATWMSQQDMVIPIQALKGWVFILVTAMLLYLLIRRSKSAMQQAEEEWRTVHQELENRLEQRTAALTQVNADRQREIAERREAEEKGQRLVERLKLLREIDLGMLSVLSPQAIAQAAVDHLPQLIPCQRGSVALFDFEAEEAKLLAVCGRGELKVRAGTRLPLEIYRDIEELRRGEARVIDAMEALRAEGLRMLIQVPMVAHNHLIGVLEIGLEDAGMMPEGHLKIARQVAGQLAIAIHHARLHERTRRSSAELERRVAERTAALRKVSSELDAFAHTVSHDLREPLGAIQDLIQALEEDYADRLPAPGRDYVRRIVDRIRRMDALIQDLLDYTLLSRPDLEMQPISLAATINDARSQLGTEIDKQNASVTVEEPLPEVKGHYTSLVRVITNLLSNSIKFVAPKVQPQVRIWAEVKDGWVRLWVKDNGIGISPEDQERIFQVFERLHGEENYPGTGIGLAIVRRGIERMGGQVGVQSQPGQGSGFWIELPRAHHQ